MDDKTKTRDPNDKAFSPSASTSVFSTSQPEKQPISTPAKVIYALITGYVVMGVMLFIISLGMGPAGFAPLFFAAGSLYIVALLSVAGFFIALHQILNARSSKQSQNPLHFFMLLVGAVVITGVTYSIISETIIKPRQAAAECKSKIENGTYIPKNSATKTYHSTGCGEYVQQVE
jgi:hypothetical protein